MIFEKVKLSTFSSNQCRIPSPQTLRAGSKVELYLYKNSASRSQRKPSVRHPGYMLVGGGWACRACCLSAVPPPDSVGKGWNSGHQPSKVLTPESGYEITEAPGWRVLGHWMYFFFIFLLGPCGFMVDRRILFFFRMCCCLGSI